MGKRLVMPIALTVLAFSGGLRSGKRRGVTGSRGRAAVY